MPLALSAAMKAAGSASRLVACAGVTAAGPLSAICADGWPRLGAVAMRGAAGRRQCCDIDGRDPLAARGERRVVRSFGIGQRGGLIVPQMNAGGVFGPGQHRVAETFPGCILEDEIGDGAAEPDHPAVKRIARHLFGVADLVAGDGAIDGADHRDVLQRIDDVEEVGEGKAGVTARGLRRGRHGIRRNARMSGGGRQRGHGDRHRGARSKARATGKPAECRDFPVSRRPARQNLPRL